MVVVGVTTSKENHKHLKGIVRSDSKRLSPQVRERLSVDVRRLLSAVIVNILPPAEIDEWVLNRGPGGLNHLEATVMSKTIERLGAETVYVDSCDVNAERFQRRLEGLVGGAVQVVSTHKADEKYPIVSAASIIAKVIRDREIEKIAKVYGDVGTGYSHDERTIAFIERWYGEKGDLPPIVRRSWRTAKRLVEGRRKPR